MAHGTPLYYVCKNCKQYILNNRFSSAPICNCKRKAEQISTSDLKRLIELPILSDLVRDFNRWTKY